MRVSPLAIMCSGLFVIVGCGDDGPAVPFKLGEGEPSAAVHEPTTTDTPAEPTTLQPTDPSLILAAEPSGALTLQRASSDSTQPTAIATLTSLPAGCSAATARVTRLSATHLWASADVACPMPVATSDKEPPSTAKHVTQQHWILEDGPSPRVLEQVRLHPRSVGAPLDDLQLTVRSEDIDHDGNPDLIGTLTITAPFDSMHGVDLRWLNRASGLDRDESEPEASLIKLAKQAKALRPNDPQREVTLGGALLVYDVLCAESGRSRVEVSQHMGVRCAPSAGAGLAWALFAAQRAESADVLSAVSALDRLSDPALKVNATDRQTAKVALEGRARQTPWQWKPGPEIGDVSAPNVRLPRVGFLDDHTLLLRGETPKAFDLTTETLSDVNADSGDVLMRDPSRRFAVVGIERHCDGLHLKIVNASQVVNGQVLGQPVSEPPFDRAPDASRCSARSTQRAQDNGGFTVLGWSPKGVVVARGPERRFIPIDANGQAAGEVSSLGSVLPLPGPWSAGRCTIDGSACVAPSEVGFALQTSINLLGHLIAPLGPVSELDVAVAPAGKHIAYVFGGRVFIGTPAASTP